jgi:arylsulfatase
MFSIDSKLTIGRSSIPAVTDDFQAPFPFKGGTLKRVMVDISGETYRDMERELAAMFMHD